MGNILLGIFYKIDLIKNELLFLGIKLRVQRIEENIREIL